MQTILPEATAPRERPGLIRTCIGFGSSSGRCAHSRHLAEAHPQVLIIVPEPVVVTGASDTHRAQHVAAALNQLGRVLGTQSCSSMGLSLAWPGQRGSPAAGAAWVSAQAGGVMFFKDRCAAFLWGLAYQAEADAHDAR